MDRYLFSEIISPFLFGIGLFTSLGVAIGTLFDLVRKITENGLPIDIALRVLLLKLPEFLVLAFPMAMLLASLMAYGRLSSDSEIIALRSIGIGIYRTIVPVLIFSLFAVGLSFTFNNFVAPAANYQAGVTLQEALGEKRPAFKERNIIYPEYKTIKLSDGKEERVLNRLFYAEEFDGEQMKGLTILDRSRQGVNQITTAVSASLNLTTKIWDFYNGTIYIISPNGSYGNIIRFEHQTIELPNSPLEFAKKNLDYNEMNLIQANEYLKILKTSDNETKIRKLQVRIQEKIALPFVCLVFALLGASLGIRPQNASRATSFGICVLLVFAYYLLSFISSSLGINGTLTPILSAWLPNLLGLVGGMIVLVKSS
jgi:lipopolysaccharide export system permease protein